MQKNSRRVFIDQEDLSSSTSRLLIYQALKKYSTKALIVMLNDSELVVRTSVAMQLQARGGSTIWKLCKSLCASKKIEDRIMGFFIMGQLGTPKLPYQSQSLDLIFNALQSEKSSYAIEHALYAIGHLRKGKSLKNAALDQMLKKMRFKPKSALAEARTFALGKF